MINEQISFCPKCESIETYPSYYNPIDNMYVFECAKCGNEFYLDDCQKLYRKKTLEALR